MSAEERLLALEQLVAAMQGEVISALTAAAQASGTLSRVSMIELDDWILAVNVEEYEKMVGSIERVMVDSGAAVSVCPLGYAPEIPMTITRDVRR